IDVLPLCNVTSARDAFAAMGSENMRKLLVSESKHYDIIVVDLPALKTDFEALNIIALLDGIVLTVSWGNTSMEVLAEVAHMLRTAKAKIMAAAAIRHNRLSQLASLCRRHRWDTVLASVDAGLADWRSIRRWKLHLYS